MNKVLAALHFLLVYLDDSLSFFGRLRGGVQGRCPFPSDKQAFMDTRRTWMPSGSSANQSKSMLSMKQVVAGWGWYKLYADRYACFFFNEYLGHVVSVDGTL